MEEESKEKEKDNQDKAPEVERKQSAEIKESEEGNKIQPDGEVMLEVHRLTKKFLDEIDPESESMEYIIFLPTYKSIKIHAQNSDYITMLAKQGVSCILE